MYISPQMTMDDLIFIFFNEEKHEYKDQFGNKYTSVTTCIHKYVPEFKKEKWAKIKAAEKGVSQAQIIRQWDAINKHSTDKGTIKHNRFEDAVKDNSKFHRAIKYITTDSGPRCFSVTDLTKDRFIGELNFDDFVSRLDNNPKYDLIFRTIKFYVDRGYRIYSEVTVFNPYYLISGMIDILLVKGNDIVIIDWKTNRNPILFEAGYYAKDKEGLITNVFIRKKEYLKPPLGDIENCTGNHYAMQLSTYAHLLELFGFTNKGLILFHIKQHYMKNKYGMPLKDQNGLYIEDKEKGEYVDHHLPPYYKGRVISMLDDHRDRFLESGFNTQKVLAL